MSSLRIYIEPADQVTSCSSLTSPLTYIIGKSCTSTPIDWIIVIQRSVWEQLCFLVKISDLLIFLVPLRWQLLRPLFHLYFGDSFFHCHQVIKSHLPSILGKCGKLWVVGAAEKSSSLKFSHITHHGLVPLSAFAPN